ncbi:conserved hypothetical protein [Ricinus communis]|uniref:Uncharacterized protein n=1 Tax=Ricinus communis TaxID=3988 RepID=B9S1E1_RICCO|nr:conserved hypothetical protein [Ricinus communis]
MNVAANVASANVAASTANAVSNNTSLAALVATVQLMSSRLYAKPFSDIAKIKVFGGQSYKRWQERVFSILDMHGIASAIRDPKLDPNVDPKQMELWTHTNKQNKYGN